MRLSEVAVMNTIRHPHPWAYSVLDFQCTCERSGSGLLKRYLLLLVMRRIMCDGWTLAASHWDQQ
jgi:hypothetical protein